MDKNSFICDGCGKEYPIEEAIDINTPNLTGIVMCKNCTKNDDMNEENELSEELTKRIKSQFEENIKVKFEQDKKKVYEIKLMAIEFAKYILNQKITKRTSMNESEEYWPSEFQLMLGELLKNGDDVFSEFIKKQIYE